MDKAILGYCRLGYFRLGVFNDQWDKLLQQFESLGSCEVTRRQLQLDSPRDSTTGWWTKSFHEETVEMPIIQKGTNQSLLPPGTYVRTDALGLTADSVVEGDEILANGTYYEVEAVRNHYLLDSFTYRECDLTLLPFKNLTGSTYTESSVEDVRYRNKVYLETYLDDSALPNYIVAYGEPDYSLVRVFKEKGVDLVYSLGEHTSDSIIDSDHYPIGYKEHVPVAILCIDKDNLEGTKLMWQAETELRRVTETYPLGSLRALSTRRPQTKRLGSTVLYSAEYMLEYERDTT
jgi:hypothetical protein